VYDSEDHISNKEKKNSRPISISRTSTIGSLASLCPSQPQHTRDEVNDRPEEGSDQRLSDVTSPRGHKSLVRHADPQDDQSANNDQHDDSSRSFMRHRSTPFLLHGISV
jgi:hypothetical protein